MTTLRMHFDGKVLVPEEPVDLPQHRPLEVQVRELETEPLRDFPIARHPTSGFPYFQVPTGTKTFTPEDILQAEDEI